MLPAAALAPIHAAQARQYDPYAYEALFDSVLERPGDAALNKRFARAAEARGDLRLAFAALERAVLSSPGDTEAQAEFDRVKSKLAPAVTRITVEGGANYASNPRHFASMGANLDYFNVLAPGEPFSISREDDATFDGKIAIVDERTLAGLRWRSLGVAQGQWQAEITRLDWQRMAFVSGPVFQINPKVWLHVAAEGAMAWLDKSKLYDDIGGSLTVGGLYHGLTQTVTARYTHRDANIPIGQVFDALGGVDIADTSTDKAHIFDLEGRFVFSPRLAKGDLFYFMPHLQVSRNNGDPSEYYERWYVPEGTSIYQRPLFPGDFTQLGGALAYYMPVFQGRAFLGAGIEMYHRWYGESASSMLQVGVCTEFDEVYSHCWNTGEAAADGRKRRDTYFEPTAHVILPSFFAAGIDLRFDYRYEHNSSNASVTVADESGVVITQTPLDYGNHVAGAHVVGRF